MRIHKTQKVRDQVNLAKRLQAELIRLIGKKISATKRRGNDPTEWGNLLSEVTLSAELYQIQVRTCAAKDVDRCSSMLCGPFFTSTMHPMPMGKSGPMVPLVQLELSELSAAAQEPLGDGVLQLWYDLEAQKERIRIIPLTDVCAQELIEFEWHSPIVAESAFPLPSHLLSDPLGGEVKVIVGLTSQGVQSHFDALEARYFEATDDEDDWLWTLLKLFGNCTFAKSSGYVAMFGTHSAIQYGAHEVNMKRLINIDDWGSTGHAQIFYKSDKNKPTEYSFWNCVR